MSDPVDLPELRRLAGAVLDSGDPMAEWVAFGDLHDALPPAVVLALLDRIDALEAGLRHITDGAHCTNFTRPPWCRHPASGRRRDAKYGADRWCDTCIALDALGVPCDVCGGTGYEWRDYWSQDAEPCRHGCGDPGAVAGEPDRPEGA